MKYRIAVKLVLFFSAALLLFSLIMSGMFYILMTKHTTQVYKDDLVGRARIIARNLSVLAEQSLAEKTQTDSGAKTHAPGGTLYPPSDMPPPPAALPKRYGAFFGNTNNYLFYLKNLREIAMTDVWIVNEDFQITTGTGPGWNSNTKNPDFDKRQFRGMPPIRKLPAVAEKVVQDAFKGQTVVTEDFNPVLEVKSLTVGTPIINADGTVSAVLLLHSPIKGLHQAISNSLQTLGVSMISALVIAGIAGILLSLTFTRPLKLMNNAAAKLAEGDYNTRTGVSQKNEIGALARTLDILAARLADAATESERLEKMRQDFVTNISHELRTPVTVIRGSLEALCDGVVTGTERTGEYHRQMLDETKHLQRLVNDLLELSRLQNADFKIEMKPLDPVAVLEDAVRAIRRTASAENISISVQKNGTPREQTGDYGRLRQLFLIILDNAVKFSDSGTEILIAVTDNRITITDCGCGISTEDLPHIFERFKKANTAKNSAGSGLGLAIAKQIAERHHFGLSCQSPVYPESTNPGTSFSCIFPV